MSHPDNIKMATAVEKAIPASAPVSAETSMECSRDLSSLLKDMSDFLHSSESEIRNFLKPITDWVKEIVPDILNCLNALDKLPEVVKLALLTMANEGWFFEPDMSLSDLDDVLTAHHLGQVDEIETALINYFVSRVDKIETVLIEKYPHRQTILQSAFTAHRNKQYTLSVPVFLAQTDGISLEISGNNYFMGNGRKNVIDLINEAVEESYRETFLAPLQKSLPLTAPPRKRGKSFNQLNRHAVLHGESLDYGTQINSLKALSFLNYIAVVFGEAVAEKSALTPSGGSMKG